MPTQLIKKYSPREAAKLLESWGTPFTHKTLSVWRSRREGPAFLKIKGRVFYTEEALKQFTQGKLVETTDSFERQNAA